MQYDEFQRKAIEEIHSGNSVIVAAPTGAGKTVIAEHVIQDCLERGEKVIYTAPIKALSNQKFRDFQKNFPDKVGILTGDVSINATASTLIMTTEIFRNKILEERSSLNEYSWIIFDEIHYLDDYQRGSVWEESLIFLPEHMKLLGLSATIPNIRELAAWLQSIHQRPIKVIEEEKRPVPLNFLYQCQGKVYDNFPALVKQGMKTQDFSHHQGKFPKHVYVKPSKPAALIEHLLKENLLPCIYFVFSRRRTEYLAEELPAFDFLNAGEKEQIKALYDELCKRYDLEKEPSAYRLRPLIERGIAYHHAGMLPTLKEVVERLFTSRLIRVIFTTETFALGINMPARSVIFDELRKFYGNSFGVLKTRDFYQMAGRAGRRSIDTEGFVFCRVNPHQISSQELYRMIHNRPEKVLSRFNASYATILNLYQKHKENLYDVYPRSFHFFQESKHNRKKAVDLLKAKVDLLKHCGHIANGQVTEKGMFASRVYGYELMLSEFYTNGLLESLPENLLGVLSAGIVFEPRKGAMRPRLSASVKKLDAITDAVFYDISRKEKRFGARPLSKGCFFHLAGAMEAWIKGESFGKILQYTDSDEGEVVRYFRMSIQILREILDAPIPGHVRQKIHRIIGLINRDVIDSEKQLRA